MSASSVAALSPAADEVVSELMVGSEAGPRRFARWAGVGVALTSIPYLWILWDLWTGGVDPLRSEPSDGNFYDLQARAMFAGHLWLPKGAIGVEAFVHDGRQYTYFGLFPSLLRMPVLVFTHSLDGRLTAPSILLAWVATALFASLLVWRVRVLVRGQALLGRGEAASLGVIVASVTGGSVLVDLAATPWVFDEDFAWSVALTVGSLFALLGLLESPSRRRVLACGALMMATSLDRAPTAYGCEIAAFLVAAWFLSGRAGDERRRWWLPVVAVGLVPLVVAGLVNTAKFGSPFALPMAAEVWTSMNAHRREFLAANGGRAFSPAFLPSTLLAYMGPGGLHFSAVFPFVTLPTTPPKVVGGAFLDLTYPTASVPASMPLFFLLACWGSVSAFRARPAGKTALARIPLVGAAAGCSATLLWGYIADRYLADLMPFFILAAAVGVADVWRRLDGRTRRARRSAGALIAALGAFGVVANVALSATPVPSAWTEGQLANFVTFQQHVSDVAGHALAGTVVRGDSPPYFAPAGELFAPNDCSGLYRSSGYSYQYIPDEQFEHFSWMPVEQGASIEHDLTLVFEPSLAGWTAPFGILRVGHTGLVARVVAVEPGGKVDLRLDESDPHDPPPGHALPAGTVRVGVVSEVISVRLGKPYQAVLVADPSLDALTLSVGGPKYLIGPYTPGAPLVTGATDAGPGQPLVSVTVGGGGTPTSLCRTLTGS